jgi:DNA-binding FrmR family transcriptional regulator
MDGEVKQKLLNRLGRLEGQVRGIARMVEDQRRSIDILTQIQAAKAALAKVENQLVREHLTRCIEGAVFNVDKKEQRKRAAELVELLERAR